MAEAKPKEMCQSHRHPPFRVLGTSLHTKFGIKMPAIDEENPRPFSYIGFALLEDNKEKSTKRNLGTYAMELAFVGSIMAACIFIALAFISMYEVLG